MLKNAIIIHGGGLVDSSMYVLMYLAKNLNRYYSKVFIGQYSFEALYNKDFWKLYDRNLVKEVKGKRGTYFGTCRDIFIEGKKAEEAINLLKKNGISTVVVCGGDGSSRQANEMNDLFVKEGIRILFPVPLTIDGINGGSSLGINQAVKESIRQIENMTATSLETRDKGQYSVLCTELQGRNRDDILAKVIKTFEAQGKIADCNLKDLLIIAIPANIETNQKKLFEAINSSSKRTLILLSEGAKIKMSDIKNGVNRKVRTLVVGHQSQANNQTTKSDIRTIKKLVETVTIAMMDKDRKKSMCISTIEANKTFICSVQPIDYFAKLNPRDGQKCALPEEETESISKYTLN